MIYKFGVSIPHARLVLKRSLGGEGTQKIRSVPPSPMEHMGTRLPTCMCLLTSYDKEFVRVWQFATVFAFSVTLVRECWVGCMSRLFSGNTCWLNPAGQHRLTCIMSPPSLSPTSHPQYTRSVYTQADM